VLRSRCEAAGVKKKGVNRPKREKKSTLPSVAVVKKKKEKKKKRETTTSNTVTRAGKLKEEEMRELPRAEKKKKSGLSQIDQGERMREEQARDSACT